VLRDVYVSHWYELHQWLSPQTMLHGNSHIHCKCGNNFFKRCQIASLLPQTTNRKWFELSPGLYPGPDDQCRLFQTFNLKRICLSTMTSYRPEVRSPWESWEMSASSSANIRATERNRKTGRLTANRYISASLQTDGTPP